MLDLKRERISYDNRVHGLWQSDGSDVPSCHLDHRDFPFEVFLGSDTRLDFGNLCRRQTGPERETQKPKSAKHLHRPPLGPVVMLCTASLRAVSRRLGRYNRATRLTYRKTSREEYARPRESPPFRRSTAVFPCSSPAAR